MQPTLSSPDTLPLLELALPALDAQFKNSSDPLPHWAITGASGLDLWLHHRAARHLDIAVAGMSPYQFAPARNPAASAIGTEQRWVRNTQRVTGSRGSVTFRSMTRQTTPNHAWTVYRGRQLAVEPPKQIVCFSIRFHAPYFSEAEAFDLAATARVFPDLADVLARQLSDRLEDLHDALCHLGRKGPGAIRAAVDPRAGFSDLPDHAITECLALVDRAIALANDDENATR